MSLSRGNDVEGSKARKGVAVGLVRSGCSATGGGGKSMMWVLYGWYRMNETTTTTH